MKTLWLKYKRIIVIVGLAVLFLALSYIAGRCSTRQERTNQINNIIALTSEIKRSEVVIDGLKSSVQEKQAIILSQDMAIKSGLVREDLLKKLHIKDLVTNTELSGVIHKQDSLLDLPVKPIFITVKDTSGVTHDYLRIPFTLLDMREKYDTLIAGMDKNRNAWYKLSMPFTGTVTVGYARSGLFKTTPKGIFTTDNPYIKINSMQTVIINEPKGLFSKWWFHIGIGMIFCESIHQIIKK